MKHNKLYLLALVSLLLCGCNNNSTNNNSSIDNNDDTSQGDKSDTTDGGGTSGDTTDDDDGGDAPIEVVEPKINNVTITNNISDFYIGETSYDLSAEVHGIDGTNEKYDRYVTFSEYDTSIIEIESNQNHPYVKALKAGTTSVKAISNGDENKYDETTITVLDPIVESISLSLKDSVNIEKNQSITLEATVTGRGSFTKNVEWSTSVANVISYTGNNKITITGEHLGSTKLTASVGDIFSSIDVNVVANFNYDTEMTYDLVSKQEDLMLNERYIIVGYDTNKAMSPSTNTGGDKFNTKAITKNTDGNQITGVKGNEVYTFALKQGLNANSYSLEYKNKYLQYGGNKNLKQVSTVDANSSWNISINDGIAAISVDSTSVDASIKLNGSLFSAYPSTSLNMTTVQLYKYSSGREQIHFPYESTINLSTNLTYTNKLIVDGFDATRIDYISSDTSLATISGSDENFTIVTNSSLGEVTLTANAYLDEELIASTSIVATLVSYVYSLNESNYALGKNNTLLDPISCKAVSYDLSDIKFYFGIEKAYTGDNSYYIISNNKYLQKSNVSQQSRVVLGETKTVWNVLIEDGIYYVYTVIGDLNYYLSTNDNPIAGDYYFVTTIKVSIDIVGVPTSISINVDSTNLVKKTYNVDETFNPNGLVVTANYVTSLGNRTQDVATKVIWDNEFVDNSILGTVTLLNQPYDVVVSGLTITNYVLDRIELDTTNAITKYVVGESVNTSGLVVKTIYKDGDNERSEIIDNSLLSVSPTTISKQTDKITVSYNGISSSYNIETIESSFKEVDHLHKGFHVVFTSKSSNQNYEMGSDGLNSTKFNEIPFGNTVFEIEEIRNYKDSTDKTIHEYRFKLIEVNGATISDEKYLAYDGKSGTKLCLITLDNDSEGKSIFEYYTNASDGFSLISKNLQTSLAFNNDSKKFALSQSSASTSTYSDVTIYYDSSILYD